MTYWVVIWAVLCPIDHAFGHKVNFVEETHFRPSWDGKNIIECPEHHVALFSRPEKITEYWEEMVPSGVESAYVKMNKHSKEWVKP